MPSPILTQPKKGTALSPTLTAKRIFRALYQREHAPVDSDEAKINVSELISKISFYYEKIRNAVDYKDDSLMRKDGVARILKRQIVVERLLKAVSEEDAHEISRGLLTELIRAGYLPNNKLPESKIDELAAIIHKYLLWRKFSLSKITGLSGWGRVKDEMEVRTKVNNWLIGLMASEIEANLGQEARTADMVNGLYQLLLDVIKLPPTSQHETDLPIQIYLALYRQWLQYDDDMLGFILLKYFQPEWDKATPEMLEDLAGNINRLYQAIDYQLNHPLGQQLRKVINRYVLYASVLRETAEGDPVATYRELETDSQGFAKKIKAVCNRRYAAAKAKLWRSAGRSIIYIFLTKSVFVVLLEIPAIQFFHEQISYLALAINISFPALLLFVTVAMTRVPHDDNTQKIIEGVESMVYEEKAAKQIVLRNAMRRGPIISGILHVVYTATFLLSFYLIIKILKLWQFSWVSVIIFIFFLAFVSFFTIRIRKNIREMTIVNRKENLLTFIFDLFATPIIATGKWLSGKFSKINVFIFILDFIIEAPFKIFVDIAEEWTNYAHERKENL